MNLYELPDKDFDERFRMAANSAGYSFNEAAWSGLEKKLNRLEKFGPWFLPSMGALVLIILGLTFFLLQRDPGMGDAPIMINGLVSTGESQPKQTGEEGNKPETPVNDNHFNKAESRNTALLDLTETETHELPDSKAENAGTVSGRNKAGNRYQPAENMDHSADRPEGFITSGQDAAPSLTPPVYLMPRLGLLDNSVHEEGSPLPKGKLAGVSNTGDIEEQSGVIPPERENSSPGYSLNLMLGPDFSGVGAEGYGTGTFAGLGFEIYLGRFSLMTGISHARKRYAVSDDYKALYSGNSSYTADPDRVEIACHVLDIPVNVYYSIIRKGRNRFFAGAGLSTYLMLTEEYHFEYDYGYSSPNTANDLILKNENQHYFGIFNITAGYSRNLGRKWALQVEPYLKLPIQDIAAAQVRLNSFGALFSLKYSIR